MEFIDVKVKLPEQAEEPHKEQLWLSTEKFGEMTGFFDNGKFMKNYACEILNVIAWLPLPKNESVGK